MKLGRSLLLFCALASSLWATEASSNPLRWYAGSWRVTRKEQPANAKPEELDNECSLIGKYFACQQTVNGTVSALQVFVAADKPGHYYTQSINPQGRGLGKGDLEVSGDKWVLTSMWDQGAKMTYYRTTSTFSGHDHIHFEQQESSNRTDWTTTSSGDYTRIRSGR